MENLTPKYNLIPAKEKIIQPEYFNDNMGQKVGNMKVTPNETSVAISPTELFKISVSGIHLGASDFASAPFKVTMAGKITATGADIAGKITATSGTIAGWDIAATTLTSSSSGIVLDDANEKITVGASNSITIDGANKRIESDNYVSGYAGAGFHLDEDLLEVGNIACRGLIRTAVFQKDVISVVGGNIAVLDGDVLDADMTVADNSTLTTKATTTFSTGDILRIKDGTDDEWLEVMAGTADSYSESNFNQGESFGISGGAIIIGQSFTAVTGGLDSCKFYLQKIGSPTGNAVAKLYAHSGTYGTSSVPTGAVLATSDNFDVSTLTTSYALATFNFTGAERYSLTAGYYCIVIEYSGGSSGNILSAGVDSTSPTHSGNYYYYDDGTSTWYSISSEDSCFYVYIEGAGSPYKVTRDKAADYAANTNPTWKKGATVVNYGQSGDGGVYMTASESNAPYLSVFTTAGSPWTDITTRLRLGNLNGYLGYTSDLYGIAIGETTSYLKYDPTNHLQIKGNIDITGGDAYNKLESNLPSDENLVGYWAFDEGAGSKAYDGSGNVNHGTLNNMEEADWISGVSGSCLDFDGTDEYVEITDDSSLHFGTDSFSITCWVKTDDNDQGNRDIIVKKHIAGEGWIIIRQVAKSGSDTRLYVQFYEDASNRVDNYISNVFNDTSVWVQIGVVIDRTDNKLYVYVNGVLVEAGTTITGNPSFSSTFNLKFAKGDYSGGYFNGKVDEVRIYKDQALTAKEIYALYKNPSGQPSLAVPLGRLTSGSIYSKQITLAVTGGTGDSYIAAGKTDFTNTDNGFILGLDDSDSDKAKFYLGNSTDYFNWDGTNVKILCSTSDALTIGYGSDILLTHGGDIKFTSVTAPTALTAALIATATGNVDTGTHKYKVTYVNATGETELGAVSNTVTNDATHKQNALTSISVSSSSSVTSRKIYRTKAGANNYHLLTTIADNTTTTYTDNTADTSLGSYNVTYKDNSSFGKIIIDDIDILTVNKSVYLGRYAGNSNVGGNYNVFIGEYSGYQSTVGRSNVYLGFSSGFNNVGGSSNVIIGNLAGNNSSGSYNTLIGKNNGNNCSGSYNIFLGYDAGYYETASNKLFIDNARRTNEADGRVKALIYGIFDAAIANQLVRLNGILELTSILSGSTQANAGASANEVWKTNGHSTLPDNVLMIGV